MPYLPQADRRCAGLGPSSSHCYYLLSITWRELPTCRIYHGLTGDVQGSVHRPVTVTTYLASPGGSFLHAVSTTGWQAMCRARSIVQSLLLLTLHLLEGASYTQYLPQADKRCAGLGPLSSHCYYLLCISWRELPTRSIYHRLTSDVQGSVHCPVTVTTYFASPGGSFLHAVSTTGWQAMCRARSIVQSLLLLTLHLLEGASYTQYLPQADKRCAGLGPLSSHCYYLLCISWRELPTRSIYHRLTSDVQGSVHCPVTVTTYFASPGGSFLHAVSTTGWQAMCRARSIVQSLLLLTLHLLEGASYTQYLPQADKRCAGLGPLSSHCYYLLCISWRELPTRSIYHRLTSDVQGSVHCPVTPGVCLPHQVLKLQSQQMKSGNLLVKSIIYHAKSKGYDVSCHKQPTFL